jgi:hypothetical protein
MNAFRKIARVLGISKSHKRGIYLGWQSIPHPSSYRPRPNSPGTAAEHQQLANLQSKLDGETPPAGSIDKIQKPIPRPKAATPTVHRAIKWASH